MRFKTPLRNSNCDCAKVQKRFKPGFLGPSCSCSYSKTFRRYLNKHIIAADVHVTIAQSPTAIAQWPTAIAQSPSAIAQNQKMLVKLIYKIYKPKNTYRRLTIFNKNHSSDAIKMYSRFKTPLRNRNCDCAKVQKRFKSGFLAPSCTFSS